MIQASIISIGTELLNGRTVNTNATYIGKKLANIGIETAQCLMVPDTKEDIQKALDYCKKESEIVIMSGGLGPTNDDITKNVLNEYFDGKLVYNENELTRLEELFSSRKIDFSEVNRQQALYPDNCDVLVNIRGTASGMHFENEKTHFYCTPGVPHEMEYLIDNEILKHIQSWSHTSKNIDTYTFRTCCYSESRMFMDIEDIIENHPELDFAFYPHFLLVDLKIRGPIESLKFIESEIEKRLQKFLYGRDEQISLEATIGKFLKQKNYMLSTAESCTGGLVSNKITQTPGSSAYFEGGIVSYSNTIKSNELNISQEILQSFGAVSEECVTEMANSTKKKFNTDFSVSISGIAGPDGGTKEKPVGTVWFGISSPSETKAFTKNLGKGRVAVQERAASYALWLLYNELIRH